MEFPGGTVHVHDTPLLDPLLWKTHAFLHSKLERRHPDPLSFGLLDKIHELLISRGSVHRMEPHTGLPHWVSINGQAVDLDLDSGFLGYDYQIGNNHY